MPTPPRRELTCTHLRSSQTASSPVSQCISINQALACPPPPLRQGLGGSPVTPGRWCGDSHPFPRNCCSRPSVRQLKSPRSCLGAAAQHLHPGTPAAACSAYTGGTGRTWGGGSGGPATARSWWLSCLLPTQIMPEHGGAGWDPSASGSSWVGLASSGSDGVGRGLLPSVGHRLPGPAWGAVNGLRWGPVWGSCCQAVCPAAQGGSGFVPPERSAGKSTWSPEQPQLGVWGWGVSGDPQPPERAQLGEDGGCTYHKP